MTIAASSGSSALLGHLEEHVGVARQQQRRRGGSGPLSWQRWIETFCLPVRGLRAIIRPARDIGAAVVLVVRRERQEPGRDRPRDGPPPAPAPMPISRQGSGLSAASWKRASTSRRLDAHRLGHPAAVGDEPGDHRHRMSARTREQRRTAAVQPLGDGGKLEPQPDAGLEHEPAARAPPDGRATPATCGSAAARCRRVAAWGRGPALRRVAKLRASASCLCRFHRRCRHVSSPDGAANCAGVPCSLVGECHHARSRHQLPRQRRARSAGAGHRRRRRAPQLSRVVSAHLGAGRRLRRLGLGAGDHVVTVLQNRWEAATIHWACQFAGIIITPLNWRSTAEELDFCLGECGGHGARVRGGLGGSRARVEAARKMPRIAVGAAAGAGPRLRTLVARRARRASARRRRGLVGDALYLGHHRATQGRAAAPARGARRRARPRGAKSLPLRRAHARRHAALSHDGRTLAARDVADRRHLRLPAALRGGARARADRGREDQQSLPRADALSRSRPPRAFRGHRRVVGAQARLRRRADDRRPAASACRPRSSRICSSITTARPRSTPSPSTRTRRPSPARPAAPASTRWCACCASARASPDELAQPGEEGEIIALLAGDEVVRELLATAGCGRQGAAQRLVFHRRHRLRRRRRRPVRDRPRRRHDHHRRRERLAGRDRELPVAASRGLGGGRGRPAGRALGKDRRPPSSSGGRRSRPRSSISSAARSGLANVQAPAPLRLRRRNPEIAGRQAPAPQAGGRRVSSRSATASYPQHGRVRRQAAMRT